MKFINTQRIADAIKAHVLKTKGQGRKAALNAIGHFETLHWYPAAFKEACPLFEVQEDGSVVYQGDNLFEDVIAGLKRYEDAIG
jgi:hypothetical protein